MARKRTAKKDVPQSTAQQLASIVKSCRDIMRKDKGLSGDLDRLPILTWIMFLKFLDDIEQIRQEEAKLAGKRFRQAIEAPYRWRDWAAKPEGMTGPELIAFINQDEVVRPDGKRGEGLFAYLRALRSANGDRRDVIARVFQGTANRMTNGYLLRDVVNKVNEIHFTSKEEIHTLGLLYESMLREMRDAAGDSGEFYTPRPVVKFIVSAIDPKLGETILDPAAGTGGFLVEAFEHLTKQSKKAEDYAHLQRGTLFGIEAKPLPYLLCQMNLLLHGLEYPEIDPGNALRLPLREIGDKDRVDIIVTNPPFGGEEERGILSNFPEDKQTAETALLFLQLIMRKLRRPVGGAKPGRCGMVVSDGLLSTKGVHSRVKEEMLGNFNLHTIVRLPKGVFAPYTPIKTNLLFFDSSGPTKGIWFYETPSPENRQMYSKTKPLKFDELEGCLAWWDNRTETQQAWYVPVATLVTREMDLDIQNPNKPLDLSHSDPTRVVEMLGQQTDALRGQILEVKEAFNRMPRSIAASAPVQLAHAVKLRRKYIEIADDTEYRLVTVQLHARGLKSRNRKLGRDIKTKNQQVLRFNDLVVAEIDAKMGGYGIVPPELEGAIVSSHYFVYEVDHSRIDLKFLEFFLKSGLPEMWIQPYVKGSTNYAAIRQEHFPLLEIRLPALETQKRFSEKLLKLEKTMLRFREDTRLLSGEAASLIPSILYEAFASQEK